MSLAAVHYAFDKQSARSIDADGRMRVRDCVISVAEVNPYYGKEIPGHKALGLDSNAVFDLFRDPEELAAAADSFNGLPLMIRHVAQTADDPRKMDQAGSVFNVRFEPPHLRGDLLITDAKAIELVESDELSDLSSSYRYTPDMTPGEFEGRKFHGRMRGIQGNHVALVEDGRASGAHVADSALSSTTGGNPVDPNDTPNGGGNADVAQALMLLTQKLEGIEGRLAKLEGGTESVISVDPPAIIADDEKPDGAEGDKPDNENKADDEKPDGVEEPDKAMDAKSVKAAIDAAVKAGVAAERARAREVEEAKRATRGDLGDMIAMDDAGAIYREALKARGVALDNVPTGTEKAVYQAVAANAGGTNRAVLANDSRSTVEHVKFNTSNIRRG